MDVGTAVITGITIGAAAVTVGGGAIVTAQWLASRLRNTIGSRRDLNRRLNKLGCGVTMQYVESLFGAPVFRQATTLEEEEYNKHIYRKNTYRTPHAWLVIWFDQEEAVKVISITVTDTRFHFRTDWLTVDKLSVVLGRSTFSEISHRGTSRLQIGARRGEYVESYYFGNPGHYAHYFLSYNDAGCGKCDVATSQGTGMYHWAEEGVPPTFKPTSNVPSEADILRFRAGTTINTLTIVAPDVQDLSLITKECIGVDIDVVRMLRI